MRDFERPDRGWCGDPSRGAAMGRASDLPTETTAKLSLRRVPLNSGGYDPGGSYWGIGAPLYCATDLESGATRYLRAANRATAKCAFPRARWFR